MRDIRNLTRSGLFGAAAIGLVATMGSAAYAKDRTGSPKAETQQFEVQKSADGKVKYCAEIGSITGSRISRTICKTAEQWERDGVHINQQ